MEIIKSSHGSYGIYKVGNKHRVVRNIKDFDTSQEAIKVALLLSRGDISEESLLENQKEESK